MKIVTITIDCSATLGLAAPTPLHRFESIKKDFVSFGTVGHALKYDAVSNSAPSSVDTKVDGEISGSEAPRVAVVWHVVIYDCVHALNHDTPAEEVNVSNDAFLKILVLHTPVETRTNSDGRKVALDQQFF